MSSIALPAPPRVVLPSYEELGQRLRLPRWARPWERTLDEDVAVAAVAVSGSPVEIDSALASGSQSVTVPASCTGVFVGVGGYHAAAGFFSGGVVTLGGVSLTAYATGGDSNSGLHEHATFFLEGSLASGSQTLAWDWAGTAAPDDGALIVVAFLTGSATSSAVRDSNGSQQAASPYPSGSVAALSGDGLISFAEDFTTSGSAWTWTNNTKVADYELGLGGYRGTTASLAFAIAAGTTAVSATTGRADDGGSSTLAIKPASAAGGGSSPRIIVSREAHRRSTRW